MKRQRQQRHQQHLGNNTIIRICFGILFYVLLAAIQSLLQNPIVDGATIAISMLVPVLCGILFGRYSGAIIGFTGTAISSFLTTSSGFEILSIAPHAIMGYLAGHLTERYSPTLGSIALPIGHILNIATYIIVGKLSAEVLGSSYFYLGLGFEIIMGVFGVNILRLIYEEMLYNFNYRRHRW